MVKLIAGYWFQTRMFVLLYLQNWVQWPAPVGCSGQHSLPLCGSDLTMKLQPELRFKHSKETSQVQVGSLWSPKTAVHAAQLSPVHGFMEGTLPWAWALLTLTISLGRWSVVSPPGGGRVKAWSKTQQLTEASVMKIWMFLLKQDSYFWKQKPKT